MSAQGKRKVAPEVTYRLREEHMRRALLEWYDGAGVCQVRENDNE